MKVPRVASVLYCLPLRGGVIALVYVNLAIAAAAFVAFGYLDFIKIIVKMFTSSQYKLMTEGTRTKVHFNALLPMLLVFAVSELAMTVVVLVGLHRERIKLIQAYLYYSTVLTVFMGSFRLLDVFYATWKFDLTFLALFLLFKIYYIISIRSLVKKQEEATEHSVELA